MDNKVEPVLGSHDPAAENAAQYALSVTERPQGRHPLLIKLGWVFAIILILVGTFGGIIGGINSIENNRTSNKVQVETECLRQIVINNQRDSAARTQIAADDRAAVDILVNAVRAAGTSITKLNAAYEAYNSRRATNDRKRNSLLISAIPADCAGLGIVSNDLKLKVTTLPNGKQTTVAVVPSTSSGSGGNSIPTIPTVAPKSASSSKVPKATTSTPIKVAPKSSARAAPTQTRTQAPILPIASCTITLNVLGIPIKVC